MGLRNLVNWSSLFFELVVVVAGIAITFAGDALIKNYYERQEVRASLQLVRDELNDNMEYVQSCDSMYVAEREAVDFLWKHKGNYYKCNQDSLAEFCNRPFNVVLFEESHEALDLIKNTGVFAKITDKELALDIIRIYGNLQSYMASSRFYSEKKIKMTDDLSALPQFRALFASPDQTVPQFWDLFTREEQGDYFLREIRNQLYNRADADAMTSNVQEVIDRIDTYCE